MKENKKIHFQMNLTGTASFKLYSNFKKQEKQTINLLRFGHT